MALNLNNLIYPYFVIPGKRKKERISSFPGVFRFSVDVLLNELKEIERLGIKKILLFGVPADKDNSGITAYGKNNIVSQALKKIKAKFPHFTVMADVCLCAYTRHGHCAILNSSNGIDRASTLKVLSNIALSYAHAGADWVAPSAMASGQVRAIRSALDGYGFKKTRIMGYSAKFNSAFYGPFRDAALCAPSFGDRSAYQLDYSSAELALKKIKEDIDSGADMVMVKPALAYLDIIRAAKNKFNYPLAAYNVSGIYALVKLGAAKKIFEEKKIVKEIFASILRAGADYIISYHVKDIAKWISQENYSI